MPVLASTRGNCRLESRRSPLHAVQRCCRVGSCILVTMSRMLEEIREQPAALERTLKAELRRAERFKKFLERRRPRLVTLVAAVSQSGESTDTNIVLSEARKRGAMTIGITNETSSSLAKLAEHVFLVR